MTINRRNIFIRAWELYKTEKDFGACLRESWKVEKSIAAEMAAEAAAQGALAAVKATYTIDSRRGFSLVTFRDGGAAKIRITRTTSKSYGVAVPVRHGHYVLEGACEAVFQRAREAIIADLELKDLEFDTSPELTLPDTKDLPRFKLWSPNGKLWRAYLGDDYVQVKIRCGKATYSLDGVSEETFEALKSTLMERLTLTSLEAA